jgi:L-threonylcarbamoyladenylate synthase
MKTIKYNDILYGEHLETIEAIITGDGIIVYPTDTLYGLGGNFYSSAVIEKIDAIKRRRDMPYSVMVPNLHMLEKLVDNIPAIFQKLYHHLLPGKFTFLFKVSKNVDRALVKGNDKIGIRIPDAPKMLKLLETLKVPFITTSVNRSGQPALNDPVDIAREFAGEGVSLLIDAGILPPSGGSTILDITQVPVKCIRRGDDYGRLEQLGIDIV